jgi:hypothetical protein
MFEGEASIKQNIIYIGLDVDDTQHHESALDKNTGDVITFKCRPTLKGLLNLFDRSSKYFPGSVFRLCYEALLWRGAHVRQYNYAVAFPLRCPSIFLMTTASSMQAMALTAAQKWTP